jgi:hypothetical protein
MRIVASSTIRLGGASGRLTHSSAKKMPWNVENREASTLFCEAFKICLNEDLDGLLAGVNFDPDRRITEIHLMSATVTPSDNRMRHFNATPLNQPPSRGTPGFAKIQSDGIRTVKNNQSIIQYDARGRPPFVADLF